MASLAPFVVRRGAVYHLRVRIPLDLVAVVGRPEYKRSLKTSCPKVARNINSNSGHTQRTPNPGKEQSRPRHRSGVVVLLPRKLAHQHLDPLVQTVGPLPFGNNLCAQ